MALYHFRGSASSPNVLEVLDVTNPLKPVLLCTLIPADGGRFDLSPNELVFWVGDKLGSADLTSGKVVQSGQLAAAQVDGAYSENGAMFAYRVFTDAGGMSTHLYQFGADPPDRTLYTQEPIGGHGGVPGGPNDQLQFSPDGTELLDYWTFRPTSGPANLLVFKVDGSIVLQGTGLVSGVWAPTAAVLYFAASSPPGPTLEIDSLSATGDRSKVASGLNGYNWPVMAPDGRSIIYDTYDTSAPGQATGGLPHLWRLDLGARATSQLTSAVGSEPVFVGPRVVWSNEEKPCQCGPGGASAPDGAIVAHDLSTGRDEVVDMTLAVPGIGAPGVFASTGLVLDVWFG
jgi:hypothetical protein